MTAHTPLPEAFYLPAGDGVYDPTHATMSPWNAAAQHGGPPAALLAREMTAAVANPSLRLGRLSVDFLAAIPRERCTVSATITRAGRRICRTEATLRVGDAVVVAASAWHIAAGGTPPSLGVQQDAVPPIPAAQEQRYFPGVGDWGYGQAIEWRFVTGSYDAPGPAQVWARPRIPIVAGQPLTGHDRGLVVGDSANGVSNELPLGKWLFIPPTMTYTALREPDGEWVLLEAETTLSEVGTGIASARVSDRDGMCATVAQPLLVTHT